MECPYAILAREFTWSLMRVFVANFGQENYLWPACRERGTIAVMNDVAQQPFWKARDKDGYVSHARATARTARGEPPTRSTASRWFNLMTIVAGTDGDLWIHKDGDRLWWTVSTGGEPTFETLTEPVAERREVVVCHKPCRPWSDMTEGGIELFWRSLHPKARDFLSTEATLQRLGPDYANYARALVAGDDLSPWHDTALWRRKNEQAGSKHAAVTRYDAQRKAVYRAASLVLKEIDAVKRMAATAMSTVVHANGQLEERRVKAKEMRFPSRDAFERHVAMLVKRQEGFCELTGLPFDYDERDSDPMFFPSLDRIDSDGPYAAGNLQVVCRFANMWKGAQADEEFRRLIEAYVRPDRIRSADVLHRSRFQP